MTKKNQKELVSNLQIKQIESSIKRNGVLSLLSIKDYLCQFSVGDIINIRELDHCDYKGTPIYYDYQNEPTNIEVKCKVVYIDSYGLPHYREIKSNGKLCSYVQEVFNHFEDSSWNGDLHKFNLNEIILLDPDFVDATLFEDGKYSPLAELKEAQKDKDIEQKAEVINYYNLKSHNKKLRVHTGSERGRLKLFNKLEIGDKLWSYRHGNITVKLKSDDIIVFEYGKNGKVIASSLDELKDFEFYIKAPQNIKDIDRKILHKWRPKKK